MNYNFEHFETADVYDFIVVIGSRIDPGFFILQRYDIGFHLADNMEPINKPILQKDYRNDTALSEDYKCSDFIRIRNNLIINWCNSITYKLSIYKKDTLELLKTADYEGHFKFF